MNHNVAHTKLVDDIIVDLCTLPMVRAFKMTTGSGVSFGGNPISFGLPGMFDILVCLGAEYAWLEVKTGEGRLNEDQKKFQKMIREICRGTAEVVRSVADARAIIQESIGNLKIT